VLQIKEKIFIFMAILLSIGLLLNTSYAQRKSVKILGLTIEGNKTTDAKIIKLTSGLAEGQEVTGDMIQEAIKRLWSLGVFSDIRLYVDKEVRDGIYLTIKVKEYPRLEKYQIKGNKKIKTKEIQDKLNLYPGQVISPNQILKAKKKILKLYEDKGYLLAKVEVDTIHIGKKDRVVVEFRINEGKKVKIKKINFYGNKHFDDGKLKKQLKKTKENKWWWFGGDFKRDKYKEDLENLLAFYRKKGFRDAQIVSDSIYYDAQKEHMFIDITIHEGERYRIRKITWEGNKLFSASELASLLPLKEGDYYNQEKLNKGVTEKLGSLYYDRGYIFAQITPREIPVGKNVLDIHLTIQEHNPVEVRKIVVKGNTKTKEKVIRRELKIFPGDIFSRDALIRSQRDVFILNYFSDVTPNVKPVDDSHVDLIIKVKEKTTDTANMSAGWSERDRLVGSVGISMNNLFGNGQSLGFDWTFGRYYRNFQISFTEPWLFDTPTLTGFNLYDTKRDAYYVGYSQKSRGGSIRIGRRFRWPDNYFRGNWVYRLDRTELGDFSDYIRERNPNNIATEHWPLVSSTITQIISRDSRDRPEFPTTGSILSFSIEFAGKILGGNVDYHKYTFSLKRFSPLFSKFVLYTDTEMGFIDGFSSKSRIPYLELFFIGGDGLSRSVPLRGYDDPLAGGTVYTEGGRILLKQSLELRFPFASNPTAYGIIFAEAGNTWSNLSNTDPFNLRRSLGIGARIFMPMLGMIGFDYAYGFDNYDAHGNRFGKWKPHFVFGRGF